MSNNSNKYTVVKGRVYSKNGRELKRTGSGKYRVTFEGKQLTLLAEEVAEYMHISLSAKEDNERYGKSLNDQIEDTDKEFKPSSNKKFEEPGFKEHNSPLLDKILDDVISNGKIKLNDEENLNQNYSHLIYAKNILNLSNEFVLTYMNYSIARKVYFYFLIDNIARNNLLVKIDDIINTSNEEEIIDYMDVSKLIVDLGLHTAKMCLEDAYIEIVPDKVDTVSYEIFTNILSKFI